MKLKAFIEASCNNNIRTGENVFAVATFEGLEDVSLQTE